MSNSVPPHRQQPTRLPHPWDSPGKNTGVGCHFLLQCLKVKSESEVAQACPTLSDPMHCSLPGSSVHGIFQARVLEWVVISFSREMLFSSVQFSHSVVSNSLWPHESQHARPPCPSPTPWAYSNSCPSSRWCHPAISSSVVPFSSCPPIPPSIRVFPSESTLHMRCLKYWSFSFSISSFQWTPRTDLFRMDCLDVLAVQGTLKSLLQHHSSKASVLWCSACFYLMIKCNWMMRQRAELAQKRQHSWPLNIGLNCIGPLTCEFFSIVNTIAVHGPWLAESADEELWLWRVDCKLYVDFQLCGDQCP